MPRRWRQRQQQFFFQQVGQPQPAFGRQRGFKLRGHTGRRSLGFNQRNPRTARELLLHGREAALALQRDLGLRVHIGDDMALIMIQRHASPRHAFGGQQVRRDTLEPREGHHQFNLAGLVGQSRDIAQSRAVLRHGARMIGIDLLRRKFLFYRPMTPLPPLLLASTSLHRKTLLERLQLPFECVSPGVDETDRPGEPAPERAARLALAKARAVAARHPNAIVIGSDQVASLETLGRTQVLHKPGNRENCRRQLSALSGHCARFDTALAVVRGSDEYTHCDLTRVQFRALDAATIENYLDREPSFDCAGGFKCEGLGVTLFDWIESRDPTALIGLPLIAVCAALRRLGVQA